jgi:hypothetical protein
MKKFLFVIFMTFSLNALSQTDFSAEVIPGSDILSISIADDGLFPPFEGGELWSTLKGTEQRKYIDQEGFSLECDALKNNRLEIFGSCLINLPISTLQKIGTTLVFKLKGAKARKLNQYFVDSAYVSIQRGGVYLSSYNTRSEFYFGIKEELIKRQK